MCSLHKYCARACLAINVPLLFFSLQLSGRDLNMLLNVLCPISKASTMLGIMNGSGGVSAVSCVEGR